MSTQRNLRITKNITVQICKELRHPRKAFNDIVEGWKIGWRRASQFSTPEFQKMARIRDRAEIARRYDF